MEARLRARVTLLYKGKCALRLMSGHCMEESVLTIFVSLAKAVSDQATKLAVVNFERKGKNIFLESDVRN